MAYLDRDTSQTHVYTGVVAAGVTAGLLTLLATGLNFTFHGRPIVDFTAHNYQPDRPDNPPPPPPPPPDDGQVIRDDNGARANPLEPIRIKDRGTSLTGNLADHPGGASDDGTAGGGSGSSGAEVGDPPPLVNYAEPAVQVGGRDSFGADDYPDADIRNGAQGATVAQFTIGVHGRVTQCTTDGAPSVTLARATCRIILSRFRFSPAKDSAGHPVVANRAQTVRWRLPVE
jgi:protein TonB